MPLDPQLDPVFDAAAQQYNLNPALLKATVLTESNGDPTAISPKGAGGISQIMPGTAPGLGVSNVFNPYDAIPGMAKALREGIDKHGTVEGALGDYYQGPNRKGGPDPAYVGTVAQHYAQLTGSPTQPQAPTGIDALAAAGKPIQTTAGLTSAGVLPPPGALAQDAGGVYREPTDYGSTAANEAILGKYAPASSESADLSDANLLTMLKTYKAQSATSGAPPASASSETPAAKPPSVAVADPNNAMYPATMIPQLMTFPAGIGIAQQIQKFAEQGFQLNKDGTLSPIKGGPHDPALLQQTTGAEAAGKLTNTPVDLRQGAATGFYDANHVFHLQYQNPHLPEAAQLEPAPAGSPPGTPPNVTQLPGGAPAIQSAATAEAAGKATYEPTTITIGGREYPVTHQQFQTITQQLGVPDLAAAAGSPGAIPTGGATNAQQGIQPPQQPNIGKTYLTPPEAGRAEELGKEYADVVNNFTHAQNSIGPLAAIQNASEAYRTGPSATTRLAFSKALQDFSQAVGLPPNDEFAKQIASGEIIGKSGTQLGFALSRTLGTREAQQLVQQAIATNPGLQNSPEGNRQLIGLIGQGLQRDLDKRQFFDDWFATHNHTYDGAGTTFNNTQPVEKYISNILPFQPKTPADYNQLKTGVRYINPDNGVIQTKGALSQ
jgi:transglycosylase-like protein with SLT domain